MKHTTPILITNPKLNKIWPVYEAMNEQFRTLYIERNISIDKYRKFVIAQRTIGMGPVYTSKKISFWDKNLHAL